MSVFDINEYDNAVEPALNRMAGVWGKKNKPYRMVYDLLVKMGIYYSVRHPSHQQEFLAILDKLSGSSSLLGNASTMPTDKNFSVPDLVDFISPSYRKDFIFNELASDIYAASAQRSAGKGEILLSLLCHDSQKAKLHGDVNVGGKNIELKSDFGTIHQEEENKFRKNDKVVKETFGLTNEEVTKQYTTWHPLPTLLCDAKGAREFYSKIYRNWEKDEQNTNLDIIEEVWNSTQCPTERSRELGYLVLLDYVQHKSIDGLLLTKQRKDGKIKAVYIQDFSDKDFIFANVTLKPQKMRGGSTEARPDGLVNISVK
jgi:hypothetical protein